MADLRISDVPDASSFARFRQDFGQRFILTVDTEEEFDWLEPLARHNQKVEAVPALRTFQTFCEERGVVPIYLVDYPVADSPLAGDALRAAI